MKQEDFKTRFYNKKTGKMSYGDYAVYDGEIVQLVYSDNGEFICMDWNYIDNIVPMLALPMKDCEGNQIYDGDILECNWSDYYDPCGTKYSKSMSVRIIADVYDAYVIPSYAKIIGNKYENKELYRETLWYLEFKARWSIITTQSYEERNKHSNLREGQVLFNALSKYYSEIAEKITGTEYDCFNDDSKIEAFKERVIDLWIEEIE